VWRLQPRHDEMGWMWFRVLYPGPGPGLEGGRVCRIVRIGPTGLCLPASPPLMEFGHEVFGFQIKTGYIKLDGGTCSVQMPRLFHVKVATRCNREVPRLWQLYLTQHHQCGAVNDIWSGFELLPCEHGESLVGNSKPDTVG
jgi:hypothetical protein